MSLERLGKYELRGILGKGASGVVYDAWDGVLERRVAVKTIRLPTGDDEQHEEDYARFKREAQAAGRLSHPGIVGVYDYGDTDGVAYIAMELIEGKTLKDLLDTEHRLTPEAAVRVMRELLDALAYSHSRGVIHRDIKPTNILLTSTGAVKIGDFGIARIESSSMTQMGTVMGTPTYMSPEQFMGQTVDQRTDIYAGGVLLYQLLTGDRPFEGGLTAIMHKVLHTTPVKPSQLSVTAPEAFDAVVARAMARRPEDRYPSAEAFSAAIAAALTGEAAPPPNVDRDDPTLVIPQTKIPPQVASTRSTATTKLRSRETVKPKPVILIGGIAAAVLVVLGAGAVLLLRPSGTRVTAPPLAIPSIVAGSQPLVAPNPAPVAVPPQLAYSPQPNLIPRYPTPAQLPAQTINSVTQSQDLPQPPPADLSSGPPPYPQIASAPPVEPPEPAPYGEPASKPPTPISASSSTNQPSSPTSIRDVSCTLLEARTGPDNRTVVTGLAGAGGPETAAFSIVAPAGTRAVTVDWRVVHVDGPYCGVLDTLRAIRNEQGGKLPGFELSLSGNRTRLRKGEVMTPVITAMPFAAHLQLVYFSSDGSVVHFFPTTPAQERVLQPGIPPKVVDPKTGGWGVGAPFGTDLMVAVVSPEALPLRFTDESADTYLGTLRSAADQLIRNGSPVLVRALAVQTTR